ncbi:MAG: pyridoxamine 5'-phosphate oxidase family protein [Alphaproteobacteria bacterium]
MAQPTFETTAQNRVRVSLRAAYDHKTVFAILDAGMVAHVGLIANGLPLVIPMVYGRREDVLYLHGAKATRLIKLLGSDPDGAPVSIGVTLVDAIVVGRSSFHSSLNYRSVVVHGRARLVTDQTVREQAMEAMTNQVLPGRWSEVRPSTRKELNATGVLEVKIETAAAKIRTGDPVDDEEDYDTPAWGGVVPVVQMFGTPYDDGRLHAQAQIPTSVRTLVEGKTR